MPTNLGSGGTRTNTADLTEDEINQIEASIIRTQTEEMIGRTVVPTGRLSPGKLEYTYRELVEMNGAEFVPEGAPFPRDKVDRQPTTVYVQKMGKGYSITREGVLAARDAGVPIDTLNAEEAARVTQKLEDEWIWETLVNAAANNSNVFDADSDGNGYWDSSSYSVQNDMAVLWRMLRENQYKLSTFIVSSKMYSYMMMENSYGLSPLNQIQAMGINVINSDLPEFGDGTYDAIAMNPRKSRLMIAEDMQSEGEYVLTNQEYHDQVFMRTVPFVYDADSIIACDLSQ